MTSIPVGRGRPTPALELGDTAPGATPAIPFAAACERIAGALPDSAGMGPLRLLAASRCGGAAVAAMSDAQVIAALANSAMTGQLSLSGGQALREGGGTGSMIPVIVAAAAAGAAVGAAVGAVAMASGGEKVCGKDMNCVDLGEKLRQGSTGRNFSDHDRFLQIAPGKGGGNVNFTSVGSKCGKSVTWKIDGADEVGAAVSSTQSGTSITYKAAGWTVHDMLGKVAVLSAKASDDAAAKAAKAKRDYDELVAKNAQYVRPPGALGEGILARLKEQAAAEARAAAEAQAAADAEAAADEAKAAEEAAKSATQATHLPEALRWTGNATPNQFKGHPQTPCGYSGYDSRLEVYPGDVYDNKLDAQLWVGLRDKQVYAFEQSLPGWMADAKVNRAKGTRHVTAQWKQHPPGHVDEYKRPDEHLAYYGWKAELNLDPFIEVPKQKLNMGSLATLPEWLWDFGQSYLFIEMEGRVSVSGSWERTDARTISGSLSSGGQVQGKVSGSLFYASPEVLELEITGSTALAVKTWHETESLDVPQFSLECKWTGLNAQVSIRSGSGWEYRFQNVPIWDEQFLMGERELSLIDR